MEAHYIGFNLWVKAVQKAGATDVDKVLAALPGLETPNCTGGVAKMLPTTTLPSRCTLARFARMASSMSCGRRPDRCWATRSPFLPGSKTSC